MRRLLPSFERISKRLDAAPLRTYSLSLGWAQQVSPKIENQKLPLMTKLSDVERRTLHSAINKAEKNIGAAQPTSSALPEDGTVRVKAFHMSYLGMDQTGLDFPLQMAVIGMQEGFHVILRVPLEAKAELEVELAKKKLPNLHLVGIETAEGVEGDIWAEDQGEFREDGSLTLPAPGPELAKLQEAGFRERIARLYPEDAEKVGREDWEKLSARAPNDYPRAIFNMVGHVAQSRKVMGHRLEKDVTHEEVMDALAADLGLDKKNIIPIEQPGDFHIDMAMVPIGPGKVLLNDSKKAYQLWWSQQSEKVDSGDEFQREMLQEMKADADRRAKFESMVAKQLQEAGIEVVRSGAALGTTFNFLNAEQGLNPDGERYFIAAGADSAFEQAFVDELLALKLGIERVYFLNRDNTVSTLSNGGSTSCRAKAEGVVPGMD